jgi:hypothetical protein
MIFVDTWAWIALADRRDQYHQQATGQHQQFLKQRQLYVTTDDDCGGGCQPLLPQKPAAFEAGAVGQAEAAHGDVGDRVHGFSRGVRHGDSLQINGVDGLLDD